MESVDSGVSASVTNISNQLDVVTLENEEREDVTLLQVSVFVLDHIV